MLSPQALSLSTSSSLNNISVPGLSDCKNDSTLTLKMSPKKRSRASSIASNDVGGSGGVGASSSRAASTLPASGPLVHASQDLDDFQASFWRYQMDLVEQGGDADGNIVDFKSGLPTQGQLPLARIKKVMKSDDQVKMISAEAPILFARACEIFISDLTCRAFLIAEEHKRRTIQRSDIAGAIGRSDLFDFLIDIVPRHESVPSSRLPGGGAAKREKTGEGKGVGRSNAGMGESRRQQQDDAVSYDDRLVHGMTNAYDDADASSSAAALADEAVAGTSSDSFHIPHTAGANVDVGTTPMTHWIHDTSGDEHSSQPDLPPHSHHAPHPHHHSGASNVATHHHGGHHHHAAHHLAGHHSHHHSPLDYSSNAGTPNSVGAGSTSGGPWSHTFSGF